MADSKLLQVVLVTGGSWVLDEEHVDDGWVLEPKKYVGKGVVKHVLTLQVNNPTFQGLKDEVRGLGVPMDDDFNFRLTYVRRIPFPNAFAEDFKRDQDVPITVAADVGVECFLKAVEKGEAAATIYHSRRC